MSVVRRCALALLLILAIPGGWLGWHYLAQRRATTTLDALGLPYDSQPVGPAWLARWARRRGIPLPRRITKLRRQFGYGPGELTYPAALKTLTWLSLRDGVNDADLIHLHEVPALKTLNLNSPTVTDAGLVHVESLEQLET